MRCGLSSHRVIDVAATVLNAAGLPEPTFVHGIQQMPLHGTSMAPSFDDAASPERRETQYFEMFCNRGIYHQGWTAVTRHSTPWVMGTELPPLSEDVWELYAPDDWTQAHDLAAEQPEKLAELQTLFILEAGKYNIFPLDDRRAKRFNADLAGRPQLVHGNRQILFGGMRRLTENSVVVTKNKSFALTAEIEVPERGAEGVIIAQGGAFGGFSLYAKDGKPAFCYNLFGLQRFKVYGEEPLAPRGTPGAYGVRVRRRRVGQGRHRGSVRRRDKVGEGRVDATVPMLFSADETTDLGSDSATPVSDDQAPRRPSSRAG